MFRKGKQSLLPSDIRRVYLVTNPVTIHERGKDREVQTTSGTYPWSFLPQIFRNGLPSLLCLKDINLIYYNNYIT